MHADAVVYRAGKGLGAGVADADPITTEVIRNALNSAANQMKRALVRTAFSPVIYEVLDFAVAIYDRRVRMLAQAPSLPTFMGTMSFCVEAAVEAVGGEEALEPGDIVLYNVPYGTGSHAQDAAAGLLRVVERYGLEVFGRAVERMFDHGEAVVRSWFERIPDGRYVGHGEMDDDGVSPGPVPFTVVVEVAGSQVTVDFSQAPDER